MNQQVTVATLTPRLSWVTALPLAVLLGACGPVRLSTDPGAVAPTDKNSTVLLTLAVTSAAAAQHELTPVLLRLKLPGIEQPMGLALNESIGTLEPVQVGNRDVYLISLAMEPGDYRLCGVSGVTGNILAPTWFFIPLLLDLQVAPRTTNYVGRITATLRPAQPGDFTAGQNSISLKLSDFTWDVVTSDHSGEDLAAFRRAFPALAKVPVGVATLPAFDRPGVGRWRDARDQYGEQVAQAGMDDALAPSKAFAPPRASVEPPARCPASIDSASPSSATD